MFSHVAPSKLPHLRLWGVMYTIDEDSDLNRKPELPNEISEFKMLEAFDKRIELI